MSGSLTCSRLVSVLASSVGSSRLAAMRKRVWRSRPHQILPQALRAEPQAGRAAAEPSVARAQARHGRVRWQALLQVLLSPVPAEARVAEAAVEAVLGVVAAEAGKESPQRQ